MAPLGGALRVRADDDGFALETVDYGEAFRLLTAGIGALDGVYTYPIETPFVFRSLSPTALRPENDVHRFLTAAVRAMITPPWFGRPCGGIRFTLQQPEAGLRDLVVSGRLERVQVIEAA